MSRMLSFRHETTTCEYFWGMFVPRLYKYTTMHPLDDSKFQFRFHLTSDLYRSNPDRKDWKWLVSHDSIHPSIFPAYRMHRRALFATSRIIISLVLASTKFLRSYHEADRFTNRVSSKIKHLASLYQLIDDISFPEKSCGAPKSRSGLQQWHTRTQWTKTTVAYITGSKIS